MSQTAALSDTKRKLLEKYLRGELGQAPAAARALPRRASPGSAPLSFPQEHIWLNEPQGSEKPPLHNESFTLHRAGPLDIAALERSFTEILRRHEIWRTTYDIVDGQPLQIIHPASDRARLPVVNLRRLPEAEREAEALRVATEDARLPFDLKQDPLVRARLVTLGDTEHRLFLTMHQSVTDGVSVYRVFPSELVGLYEAFAAGQPSRLPDLPIQYADFACWQREWLQGEVLANQLAYWRKQLAGGLPVLAWPTERPRPARQTFRGAILPFTFSRRVTEQLKELSQREGVSLFMVLLAGFAALLYGYTRQEDIVVGTPAPSGRKRPEVQGLLGYFLNPVPLRTDLSGNPSFRALLSQARRVVSEALSNDDVPLHYLVQELKPKPDPARHPFFQVAISLAPAVAELAPGWRQTFMDVESGGARWDLFLELSERPTGLLGRAQYNPDLFDPAALNRTLRDFEALLEAVSANPDQRLADLARPFAYARQ